MASRKPKWTQAQHAARRRNWCIYCVRGMIGLLVVLERYQVRPASINRLRVAMESILWDVDVAYHEHLEKINRGEYIEKRDQAPSKVIKVAFRGSRRKVG